MSNEPFRLGRRHFLMGAGAAALGIPFLSSLEKPARAGGNVRVPRFFCIGTDHGGSWDTNFFPTSATPNKTTVASGHKVAFGNLAAKVSGGRATMSQVLSASSAVLTPALVAKLNVLRGLDVPWYIAHNTGQHLGNFARNDNNGSDGAAVTMLGMRPTVDQLLANSMSFYSKSDLASTTLKSMVINPGRQLSWTFADPSKGPSSAVTNVQGLSSSLQLFDSIFGSAAQAPTRPPVIDKVLANYKSLRESNTRLSSADKSRLDTHIAMLADLDSSLKAQLKCTAPVRPTEDANAYQARATAAEAAKWGQLFLDVVAAAFSCGASRIGVFGWGDTSSFSDYSGTDWHHDVAHQWYLDQQQAWLAQSYQAVFEKIFVHLAAKLDQLDDGHGNSVLDNSLLVWSQECCMETHTSVGVQVVTAGSAAGYLNTGRYCDYRNTAESSSPIVYAHDLPTGVTAPPALASYQTYPGLLFEQWLATAAQSMGLPQKEFELWKDAQGAIEHGIGTPFLGGDANNPLVKHYKSTASPYFKMASEPLPFLKA